MWRALPRATGGLPEFDATAQQRIVDIGVEKAGTISNLSWNFTAPENPHCSELKAFCEQASEFRQTTVSWNTPYIESGERAPPVHCPQELTDLLETECPDGALDVPACRYAVQQIHVSAYSQLAPFGRDEPAATILTQEVHESPGKTPVFTDVAGDLNKPIRNRVGPTAGNKSLFDRLIGTGSDLFGVAPVFHFLEPMPRETIAVPRTRTPLSAVTVPGWSNLHFKDITRRRLWPQVPGCQTSWRMHRGPGGGRTPRWFYDNQDCVHLHGSWFGLQAFDVVNTGAKEELKWILVRHRRGRGTGQSRRAQRDTPGALGQRRGNLDRLGPGDVHTADNTTISGRFKRPNVPRVGGATPMSLYQLQTVVRPVRGPNQTALGDMFRSPIFISTW